MDNKSLYAVYGSRIFIFVLAMIVPFVLAIGPGFNDVVDNTFLNTWAQYDAIAYLDIAENGYNSNFMSSGNYQWWPLLPMLIKLFSLIMSPVLAGFLIVNACFFAAMWYLYELIEADFGKLKAKNTLLYLVLFPTSYFFSSIYSESVFLLCTVAALYYGKRKRWGLAGLFGGLSALTRIFGVFIIFPLGYLYLKERGWSLKKWSNVKLDKQAAWLLLIPLFFLLFCGQMYMQTGDPLKFMDHSQTSNRQMALPFSLVVDEIGFFMESEIVYKGYHAFNLFVYLSFVILAILGIKRLPPEYSMYLGYSVAIPTISTPIQGFTRYVLVMFPAFLLLTMFKDKWYKRVLNLWLVACVGLMILFTFWHARGGIVF